MTYVRALLPAVVIMAATSAALQAQTPSRWQFGVGGGVSAPTGDFRTGFRTGWNALAAVGYQLPTAPLEVRLDGMYGQDNVRSPASGKSKLAGANADLAWDIGRGRTPLNVYLLGGVGAYNVKADVAGSASTSVTKFAWNGGAGTSYGLGRARLFVEGRYVSISTSGAKTNLVPVTAGISFGGI